MNYLVQAKSIQGNEWGDPVLRTEDLHVAKAWADSYADDEGWWARVVDLEHLVAGPEDYYPTAVVVYER